MSGKTQIEKLQEKEELSAIEYCILWTYDDAIDWDGSILNEVEVKWSKDAAAELASLREWIAAVEDACSVGFVELTTPQETISNLIACKVEMALDPQISRDAKALIEGVEAERDALKYVVKQYSRHDEWCKTWLKKDCECGYKKAALDALKGEK
jgi:hypothetical protein